MSPGPLHSRPFLCCLGRYFLFDRWRHVMSELHEDRRLRGGLSRGECRDNIYYSYIRGPGWCFHTRARQRQDKCWTCAFLLCLSHQVRQTWCERHNRNAQVQLLSCRCLVVVLLWCESTISLKSWCRCSLHTPSRLYQHLTFRPNHILSVRTGII